MTASAQLRDRLALIDEALPEANDTWRAARHLARRNTILQALGVSWSDLEPEEQATVVWLAGLDEATVARVASLMEHTKR